MSYIWQVCMNFSLANLKTATLFAYLCCHSLICFTNHSSTRILQITWIFKEKSEADKDQNAKIKVGTKSSNSCQAGLSFQRHSISRGPVTNHNFEENGKADYTRVPRVPPSSTSQKVAILNQAPHFESPQPYMCWQNPLPPGFGFNNYRMQKNTVTCLWKLGSVCRGKCAFIHLSLHQFETEE